MITILFNTETNKPISPILPNGYRVNGQPQAVEPPVFELQYLPTEPPAIEPTQYTTTEWVADTEVGTYTQVWAIHDKTPEQIQARDGRNRKQRKQQDCRVGGDHFSIDNRT